ncbi:solute carrier family 4 member 11-like [Daphnia carinata]|uniref:solute carrier family 4 member 11-like n=1 Tax=Daphnia carinata TaxID=120202 RepID=UPI00286943A8|nr:solute carrier family 4 member 11-like [Daphnia carinata]
MNANFAYDESWMCLVGDIPSLVQRHMAIVRLKHPTNMGTNCRDLQLFVLIVCPAKEKGTKNALETGRTFATLLADHHLHRQSVELLATEEEFKQLIFNRTRELIKEQQQSRSAVSIKLDAVVEPSKNIAMSNGIGRLCQFGQSIREDLSRRLPHYVSDYADGIVGVKTPQKENQVSNVKKGDFGMTTSNNEI